MEANLVQMIPGQKGIVKDIKGGSGFIDRINRLGLREGKEITKLSSIFKKGPVTVCVDNLQIAIGYGKATRIIVEVNKNEKNCASR